MNKRWKAILIAIIQIALFAFVVYFLFKNFNFSEFRDSLLKSRKGLILASLLLLILNELVMAARWLWTCRTFHVKADRSFFIKGIFMVKFLDYFIPLPAADDFYKLILLKLKGESLSNSVAGATFDKIMGLLIILLILPLSMVLLLNEGFIDPSQYAVYIIPGVVLAIVCIAILVRPQTVVRYIEKIFHYLPFERHLQIDGELLFTSYNMDRIPRLVIYILGNLFIQAAAILLLFLAFDLSVNYMLLCLLMPLFTIARILPISYQGFGLYEASIVFFLGMFTQLPKDIIYNISVIHLGISILIYLYGGVLLYKSDLKKEMMEAIRIQGKDKHSQ